jgi:hypothetical protein
LLRARAAGPQLTSTLVAAPGRTVYENPFIATQNAPDFFGVSIKQQMHDDLSDAYEP